MKANRFIAVALALALSACGLAPALAQTNNSSQWTTPGQEVVGGLVQMCLNATSQAVPCNAPASGSSGTPPGATPVQAFATGTTAGATATLPASATQFTYLCGLHVEVGSATAAIPVNVTATGLKSGTFTSSANAPVTAATATAGPIISQTFSPCLPSSAINTAIAVAAGSLGAGGVNQNVNAWGYQQ